MVSANPSETESEERKDEVSYWKNIAEDSLLQLKHVKEEFEEYQKESVELEGELETQLEQQERKVAELLQTNCKLTADSETTKERYETREREDSKNLTKLQHEMAEVTKEKETLKKYVRELEQANDDLERSKRVVMTSLEEMEGRVNNLMERNAFLESELEEKQMDGHTDKMEVCAGKQCDDVSVDTNDDMDVPSLNDDAVDSLIDDDDDEDDEDDDDDENDDDYFDSQIVYPLKQMHVGESPLRNPYDGHKSLETQQQIHNTCAKVEAHVDDAISKTDDVLTTLNRCQRSCINNNNNNNKNNINNKNELEKSDISLVNEEQRILALDILSDLLSKVGALETKFEPITFQPKPVTRNMRSSESSSPISERSLRMHNTSSKEKYSVVGTKIPRCINNNNHNLARYVKINM